MFKRNILVRSKGFKRYKGNHKDICRKIIDDCWNGRFFQVSSGHFQTFYVRDFSWCIKPLIDMGYKDKVEKTLQYALYHYKRYGGVSVAITKKGKPFDFPRYAVDSLPSMIRCLKVLRSKKLISRYKTFLEDETIKFKGIVIREDGLVKNGHFSSIRDHYVHNSCCYDNTMVAMLSDDLDEIGLENPFSGFDYPRLIKKHFWKKDHFIEERDKDNITGESNIFPFWCGIFSDKEMIKKTIMCLQRQGLDKPFPLKYSNERMKEREIGWNFLASNYEGDSIWMHIGLVYLEIVKMSDRRLLRYYIEQYKILIEKYKNFLEVYDREGDPFTSPLYYTDESMLWASIYLGLV